MKKVETMNSVLKEDLDIISRKDISFSKFNDKTVLVTGATGLIGSLIIKTLLYCKEVHNLNLKIIALIRDTKKADEIFGDVKNRESLEYIVADLMFDELNIKQPINYIIHAAAITTSKTMVSNPVETIITTVNGTEKILDLAVQKNVESIVYISSMEIYGKTDFNHMIAEKDLGYIDIASIRSCYPEGKRMCECLCACYAYEYNLNVKSARLAQTFGAGILPTENRVFAQFARSVVKGEDIVLHTQGKSEGNYVYTRDAVWAILVLLLEGEKGEAYNISNEESHITVSEMAELVVREFGKGESRVIFDIPEDSMKFGYAPDVKMHLDSKKMQKLGWKPEVGLIEAYRRMIDEA